MSKGDIHTLPHNGRLGQQTRGQPARREQCTQEGEAQAKGREMTIKRKVEHLIHNKDGTIGQRNSYEADPRRRKG